MLTNTKARWSLGLFAGVTVAPWLASLSGSYQACAAKAAEGQGQYRTGYAEQIFSWFAKFAYCEGVFFEANSSAITALATFAIAAFTYALHSASKAQHAALISANKTAQRAADAAVTAQRPWIEIVSVDLDRPLVFRDDGKVEVSLSVRVRNIGKTPATNVGVHHASIAGYINERGTYVFRIEEAKKKARAHAIKFLKAPTGIVLFPNEPGQVDKSASWSVRTWAEISGTDTGRVFINFGVCVGYLFGGEMGLSEAGGLIRGVQSPISPIPARLEAPIQLNEIVLERDSLHDGAS